MLVYLEFVLRNRLSSQPLIKQLEVEARMLEMIVSDSNRLINDGFQDVMECIMSHRWIREVNARRM